MFGGDDSSDYNSDDNISIQIIDKPVPSSSLKRNHDEDISSMKIKQLKMTKLWVSSSASASKMRWSRNDKLVILRGIVAYQNEKKSSYNSDWDSFYHYIKDSFITSFTKKQLWDKIASLKRNLIRNQAVFGDGKGRSFVNHLDDEVFKLSMIIWAKKEPECASNVKMDQANVSNNIGTDMTNGENYKSVVNGEKLQKNEGDGVDDFCVLKDALETTTLFQSLSEYQQKLVFKNLKNLGAQRRKKLTDEWKGLLDEELRLKIKKQSFSTKLADAGLSP